MDSDLFEDWVREQDKTFERQNRKVLLTVDNCPANPKIGGLKAIELCFLPPNTTSIIQPMDQGFTRSLKAKYRSRITHRIIEAFDANKSIPNVNVLDAMKMVTVCWENVTEKTVRNCFAKSRISAEDKASAQNDLDDPFVELRINMEKLKYLGVIPEELTPEKYADFDDTVAATEPVLSDESILAMVRDGEESIEVEDDEEEGADTNKVLEKPTAMQKKCHRNPIGLQSFYAVRRDSTGHIENFDIDRNLIIQSRLQLKIILLEVFKCKDVIFNIERYVKPIFRFSHFPFLLFVIDPFS